MYNNDYMYAIERNGEYLAHYGVRGMKWGVRKAIQSGNSARLSRQYAKASKKLAKLEKQAGKSKKYARRAALMGAGAAAAGGLAAVGTGGVGTAMRGLGRFGSKAGKGLGQAMVSVGNAARKSGIKGVRDIGRATAHAGRGIRDNSSKVSSTMLGASKAVDEWGRSNSIANTAATKYGKLAGKYAAPKAGGAYAQKMVSDAARGNAKKAVGGISNNTIARIGAGAVGAGLAAGAARNAYKAATAKKKAERFRSEMNKAFAGTKYANGGNRQGKKRRK